MKNGIPIIAASASAETAGTVLFSTVNGTAFLHTNGCSAALTAALTAAIAHNDVIEFTDATGNKIWGYAKAAGTGTLGTDNLGAELITAWFNVPAYPYETFTVVGTDITSAINTTSFGVAYQAFALSGKLFKFSNTYTLNSGTAPGFGFMNTGVLEVTSAIPLNTTSYITGGSRVNCLGFRTGSGVATNFSATSNAFKQITAPSSAGVTITNTPGGTTYNWGVKDANFNPNGAVTWRVLASTKYGQLATSGTVATGSVSLTLTDGSAAADLGAGVNLGVAYVGATGATKYILVLEDDAGKIIKGHIGELVGGSGCKIYSARNGSTQNYETNTAGFNVAADPMKYRIYRDF
jgi:hypothetical protein